MTPGAWRARGESGQTLILLLAVAAMLLPLGAGFVSSMFLQQRLAGDRYRATAALYLAEAGIEKTLWHLQGEAPDGSRDASWRPRGHTEELQLGDRRGRFTVEVRDEAEGRVAITSTGQVGSITRGVKVVAKVAPGALDYALFGAGLVAIDGDQAALSLVEVRDHCLSGVMLASNAEIWFRTPGSRLEFLPCGQNEAVLRIGQSDPLRLTVGDAHGTARYLGLREFGVQVGRVDVRTIPAEASPAFDAEALRRRAERNEANAALNRAAGEAADRPALREKRHSLYTAEEFTLLMRYLRGREGSLVGGIYVTGGILLPADAPVTVFDGFLASEGGLIIEPGGRLSVRHSRSARLLPGVMTIGKGAPLVIGEGTRVEVEGVVASEGLIDLREGSFLQVVGAVIAAAPDFSLRLNNATLRIRYDPLAPGTVGLFATGGRRRVLQLAWQELR